MTLSLNHLSPAKNSKKRKKRVGRGNASGHGTYATRGLKGQKARSGGRGGLKRLGFRNIWRSTPKLRGFKSIRPKPAVINLELIEKKFPNGATITPLILKKNKLIDKITAGVKILGQGSLSKKFNFYGFSYSAQAREKIIKAGGLIK